MLAGPLGGFVALAAFGDQAFDLSPFLLRDELVGFENLPQAFFIFFSDQKLCLRIDVLGQPFAESAADDGRKDLSSCIMIDAWTEKELSTQRERACSNRDCLPIRIKIPVLRVHCPGSFGRRSG